MTTNNKTFSFTDLQAEWDRKKQWRKDHVFFAYVEDVYDFFRYVIPRVSRDWYYEVIYAKDRVFRGYDDRMVFDLHNQHAALMIKVLTHFRKTHVGSPIISKQDWELPNNDADNCHTYWNDCLDKMIAGFKAMEKITDMDYMDMPTKKQQNAELKRLTAEWKTGMKLFVDHYQGLWD